MKFENPMMKIEYLSNLDVVLKISNEEGSTNITPGGSTDYSDTDFGF